METARLAGVDDVEAIAILWHMAVSELQGERGGKLLAGSLFYPDVEQHLRQSVVDPESLVVLGSIDAVPVGFARAVCDQSGTDLIGRIEWLYVEPHARGVGVAEAMVDRIVPWCEAAGCVGIDAPALPGNRPAKAFFEDHGFIARLLVMHRDLEPGRRSDG